MSRCPPRNNPPPKDVVSPDHTRRRRLARGILASDAAGWTPPDEVVLDTNLVAEALPANQPEHAA